MLGPGSDWERRVPASRQGGGIAGVSERGSDGVPGQVSELRGLRRPLHLDGRRATVLRRQELQKRAEALQELQSQARSAPVGRRRRRPRTRRNHDQLLGLQQGNDSALPPDPGPSCVLPRVLPVAEVRGGRRRLAIPFVTGAIGTPHHGLAVIFLWISFSVPTN